MSETLIPFDETNRSGIELEFDGHGGESVDGRAAARRRRKHPALHRAIAASSSSFLPLDCITSIDSTVPVCSTRTRSSTVPCHPGARPAPGSQARDCSCSRCHRTRPSRFGGGSRRGLARQPRPRFPPARRSVPRRRDGAAWMGGGALPRRGAVAAVACFIFTGCGGADEFQRQCGRFSSTAVEQREPVAYQAPTARSTTVATMTSSSQRRFAASGADQRRGVRYRHLLHCSGTWLSACAAADAARPV